MTEFSFTIAIPTYNRPELLRRALISVEKQTLPATEVIVSDNASSGDDVIKVVNDFLLSIPNLKLVRHEKNIGAEANFFGCLQYSTNDLFLWLADDDELSPDCLQELIHLFQTIDGIVTAVPRWHFYNDIDSLKVMPPRSYRSSYWLLRAAKFMYKATDELFYGLHKRDILTHCTLKRYFWPNRKETLNLVYPYLLEMVIAGKVVVTDNEAAYWKNHDYGIKYHAEKYNVPKELSVSGLSAKLISNAKYVMRRINLQVLYLSKVKIRGGYLPAILLSFVSILSVCRDVFGLLYDRTLGRLKHRK